VADPKHDETFRVIDRRLFNEEGELRKDVVAEEERRTEETAARKAAQDGAKTIQSATAGTATDARTDAGAATVNSSGSAIEAGTPDAGISVPGGELEAEQPGLRGFQMLVDFLTRNAAAMLGGMADPRTGQAFLDLDGARDMIDMLDALRETTKGNLGKADSELLVEVIGSLKMTFMEISKAAAEHRSKHAQGKV
jgi:hypothetical protein